MTWLDKIVDPNLLRSLPLGEKASASLYMSLLGMGVTFAALGIVWGVVVIFTRFFRAKPDSPPPAAPSVKPLLLLQDEDAESEITTVIVSALAAALEAPPGGIRVRAIRAITDPTPSWGKAGRMEELNSSL